MPWRNVRSSELPLPVDLDRREGNNPHMPLETLEVLSSPEYTPSVASNTEHVLELDQDSSAPCNFDLASDLNDHVGTDPVAKLDSLPALGDLSAVSSHNTRSRVAGSSMVGHAWHDHLNSLGKDEPDLPLFEPSEQDHESSESTAPIEQAQVTDFSFMIESMFARHSKQSDIELPRETNFGRIVFEDPNAFSLPKLPASLASCKGLTENFGELERTRTSAALHTSKFVTGQTCFEKTIRQIRDEAYTDQRTILFEGGVEKWLSIIQIDTTCSEVGRQIAELEGTPDWQQEAKSIVSAVLGVKSPLTIVKRANSILSLIKWQAENCSSDEHPWHEKRLWKYFEHLKQEGAATTGSSLLSALRFMKHVFGFSIDAAISSKRLKGLSDQMMSRKSTLRQASVLTVNQVVELHRMMTDDSMHPYDRLFCSYILLALYGRCRHSDLACLTDGVCDFDKLGGFVEFRTSLHKTSRSAASKSVLLPILVPATGVHGRPWIHEAAALFDELGLAFTGTIDGPLLPVPKNPDCSEWCKRGVSSKEVTDMLNLLLKVDRKESGLSSHSLKSTALSWCSKYGMSQPDRSVLGRHVSVTCETSSFYARDLAIGPTRRLQEIIMDISRGVFCPDAFRSGYFPECPVVQETVPETVDLIKTEDSLQIDGVIECSDTSSSSESSSSSETEPEEPPSKQRKMNQNAAKDSRMWYIHKKSCILHLYDRSISTCVPLDNFACGRPITGSYQVASLPDMEHVKCTLCRRRQ